jgi:hypothetical protein
MNDSFGHLNRMIGLQLEMHVYHAPRRHDEGEGKHVGRCHGAGPCARASPGLSLLAGSPP